MRFAIMGVLMVAVTACTHEMSQMGSASGTADITPDPRASAPAADRVPSMTQTAAYHDVGLSTEARVNLLKAEVAAIDARVSNGVPTNVAFPLDRAETVLSPDTFADITTDHWGEMITYTDGSALRRIRMRPASGTATEEFYYDGGNVIAVHFEADGDTKEDPHSEVGGQMFYFGQDGLLEWVRADGTLGDPASPAFKHWAEQLPKEAVRFPLGR